jgi:hypothetical protein
VSIWLSSAFSLSVIAKTSFMSGVTLPSASNGNNPSGGMAYSSSLTKWGCRIFATIFAASPTAPPSAVPFSNHHGALHAPILLAWEFRNPFLSPLKIVIQILLIVFRDQGKSPLEQVANIE